MPYVFNPLTGNFDAVIRARTDGEIKDLILEMINKIATSDRNALGNLNFFYDPVACKWVEAGHQIVTDEDGNVVVEDDE